METDRRAVVPTLVDSSLWQALCRVLVGYAVLLLARLVLKRLLAELFGALGFEANPAKPAKSGRATAAPRGTGRWRAQEGPRRCRAGICWPPPA